jgi:hypothetical protein
MSVEFLHLKEGDRFWIAPEFTGLGKPYWFIIEQLEDGRAWLKLDGEYIDKSIDA